MSELIPLLLGASFALLFCLPFLPALREVLAPRDEYPLPIDLHYSRNPRFLGQSAWRIVAAALGERRETNGTQVVHMSKEETIEVSSTRVLSRGSKVENVLCVNGDLTLEREVVCEKDVFVTGATRIGPECTLRVLCCKGSLAIGARSRVVRWIDADGDVDVGEQVLLGLTAAGGRIKLGRTVEFKRLCGAPIVTAESSGRELAPIPSVAPDRVAKPVRTIEDVLTLHRESLVVEKGKTVAQTIVVREDFTLGEAAVLDGSARIYGSATIGAGAVVKGDVFCEGPIAIARDAQIYGNVFSQDSVRIGRGARIGTRERPKSVIAKKELHLEPDVQIYGYVLADGRGVVA